jgi:hypothetical protein
MLRVSRSSAAFDARLAKISGNRIAQRGFTRRSKIALSAGFVIAAAAAILIGPNLGSVFAEDDSNASFWRAEHARRAAAKPAPAPRQAAAQVNQTRPQRQQAQTPPRQMSAYAPAPQPRVTADEGPFWFFNRPGGPMAPTHSWGNQTPHAQPPMNAQGPRRRPTPASAGFTEAARAPTARMVCVRLCDGFFFPAPAGMSATDAGCAAVCPNAPTRLYSMRSDRIIDAVSVTNGSPYTRLPVALHYTRSREQTCSCGGADPRSTIMADRSLRQGDRFMTENGFLIYQGGRRSQASPQDFATLANARNVPAQERRLLGAMERVSVVRGPERFAASAPPAVQSGTHVALGPPARPLALR